MREAASFIASQTGNSSSGFLSNLLQDLGLSIHWWNNRRQVIDLNSLDDHMLADLGLSREDVEWALNQPFAYDPTLALNQRALRNRERGWRG